MRYEATQTRGNRYAVRPAGSLGTCGWIDGKSWIVVYINARSASQAMLKFHCSHNPARGPAITAVDAYVSEGLGEMQDFCPSDNA